MRLNIMIFYNVQFRPFAGAISEDSYQEVYCPSYRHGYPYRSHAHRSAHNMRKQHSLREVAEISQHEEAHIPRAAQNSVRRLLETEHDVKIRQKF